MPTMADEGNTAGSSNGPGRSSSGGEAVPGKLGPLRRQEQVGEYVLNHGSISAKDLAGIFAVCEPNANGTLEALRNAGLNKQVKMIAFDPSDALIEALGDGSCSGIVLQDPVQMGYQSVKTLVAAIHGESAEAFISTGEYVATPENMNEERIQTLLKPAIID